MEEVTLQCTISVHFATDIRLRWTCLLEAEGPRQPGYGMWGEESGGLGKQNWGWAHSTMDSSLSLSWDIPYTKLNNFKCLNKKQWQKQTQKQTKNISGIVWRLFWVDLQVLFALGVRSRADVT